MERNVSRTSLFDCQRPLTLLQASRRRPKFSTQLSSLPSNCFECSTSGGPTSQPIWRESISCFYVRAGCIGPKTFSLNVFAVELGGGEGVRTPDLRLAKPALCQLSYAPKAFEKGWLRGRDLNPRPLGYEPNELPDCSTPRHPNN